MEENPLRILIVGADGMIGYCMWAYFSTHTPHHVVGSIRSRRNIEAFNPEYRNRLLITGAIDDDKSLEMLFANAQPDIVINCAGATAHIDGGESPLIALPSNSLLPHRLHAISRQFGARFIHLSTDCVFDGENGGYSEKHPVNAKTFYGLSKALGEVVNENDAVTIRTSPVGFEISSRRGLLAWFLDQSGVINGFTNAYFSGLTNLRLAKIIDSYFIRSEKILHGLYHVTGPKISKFDLISKFKDHFGSIAEIIPDGQLVLDRSLDGQKFTEATGYRQLSWDEMILELIDFAKYYPEKAVTTPNLGTVNA